MDVSDKTNAALHGATDTERDALKQAVKTDLQPRRELAGMSKPELIELVMQREADGKRTQDAINALHDRVRNAYEDV